jgi:hypothetical protein
VLFTPGYYLWSDTYDPSGNLYLAVTSNAGGGLLLLPAGSTKFELMTTDIEMNHASYFWPTVQWADGHLIVSSIGSREQAQPQECLPCNEVMDVYELSVQGSKTTKVRTTVLNKLERKAWFGGQVWVQGDAVLVHTFSAGRGDLASWAYPRGGLPDAKIVMGHFYMNELDGVVVSPGS